jgi:hypothetical protein
MPNYNQTNIQGTQWQRCHTVKILNPLENPKQIFFEEEIVVSVGEKHFHEWTVGCSKQFESGGSFPLLNPETGVPSGQSMTHQQLYEAIYSLYMQTAGERDASST